MTKQKVAIPIGIKLISAVYFILGAGSTSAGIIFLAIANRGVGDYIGFLPFALMYLVSLLLGGIVTLGGAASSLLPKSDVVIFVILGISFLLIGIVCLFVGKNLWNRMNWARISAIIFCVVVLISTIFSIILYGIGSNVTSIPAAIIQLAMGIYLLFNKHAKNTFV